MVDHFPSGLKGYFSESILLDTNGLLDSCTKFPDLVGIVMYTWFNNCPFCFLVGFFLWGRGARQGSWFACRHCGGSSGFCLKIYEQVLYFKLSSPQSYTDARRSNIVIRNRFHFTCLGRSGIGVRRFGGGWPRGCGPWAVFGVRSPITQLNHIQIRRYRHILILILSTITPKSPARSPW